MRFTSPVAAVASGYEIQDFDPEDIKPPDVEFEMKIRQTEPPFHHPLRASVTTPEPIKLPSSLVRAEDLVGRFVI